MQEGLVALSCLSGMAAAIAVVGSEMDDICSLEKVLKSFLHVKYGFMYGVKCFVELTGALI